MSEILKSVLIAAGILGIMGFAFGILLAFASKVFYVKEDERKEKMIGCLPGANCGGCGYAGCGAYVDAILTGEAPINLCNGAGQQAVDALADILGVASEHLDAKVAHVLCSGTDELTQAKFQYQGMEDCIAASRLLDGYMQCKYGCLGFGTCARACTRGAIEIQNGVAVVDRSKCGGCGDCVSACPKQIIKLISRNVDTIVACASHEKGAKAKKACGAGCIGCKLCEKNCPNDAIHVIDNLAVIDYEKCTHCGICAQKCPTKIIRGVR